MNGGRWMMDGCWMMGGWHDGWEDGWDDEWIIHLTSVDSDDIESAIGNSSSKFFGWFSS
mgnify:CR=1 FL=1